MSFLRAIRTLSASGIKNFSEMLRVAGEHSAMKRTTQRKSAKRGFSLQRASSAITGQVIYVDWIFDHGQLKSQDSPFLRRWFRWEFPWTEGDHETARFQPSFSGPASASESSLNLRKPVDFFEQNPS